MSAKRKYIVAGNHKQANDWVMQQKPEPGVRYYYISGPHMLKGESFPPEDVIYTGTYWENPKFVAITQQLYYVHETAKKANGM